MKRSNPMRNVPPPIVDRDVKPDNIPADVDLVWHEEVDPRRIKRVAAILADILDNETTPGEVRK